VVVLTVDGAAPSAYWADKSPACNSLAVNKVPLAQDTTINPYCRDHGVRSPACFVHQPVPRIQVQQTC
jgi:hypothetical protein